MPRHTDFRVLGRLDLLVDQRSVPIAAAKQRVLLAALLLNANETLNTGELTYQLWGERPPRTARATLQTYVQRLRRVAGVGDRLVTTSTGYQISVAPEELDLARFRSAVRHAAGSVELAEQSNSLRQALDEWRGHPLADVPSPRMQTEDIPLLEEERLAALKRLFDVELELGRHQTIVRDLQATIARHPLHEPFYGQLVLALYRSGRQAHAFATYHQLKLTLAEQLGVDPSQELQDLHQAILLNSASVSAPTPMLPVPRQLPAEFTGFVGREEERRQIIDLLTHRADQGVRIALISGAAGIGKTSLAVHVGQDVQGQFTDGQLYADLRGHAHIPALEPTQVLTRFLTALGVPDQRMPADLDSLVSLYRTTLATRRVLLVLDNAASAQQVRPLLPNSPNCSVLITSRTELRGLTALQGAKPFRLDVLSSEHAQQLLTTAIGRRRAAADPEAVAELARLCGHLPLALGIVGVNLAAQANRSVSAFVAELRNGDRLRSFEIEGDGEATVRSALDLSHASLHPASASMFCLLGLMPSPSFTIDAAAALAGIPRGQAERELRRLDVANLIRVQDDGRYQIHDLIRLYAIGKIGEEPQSTRDQARRRLHTYYLKYELAAAGRLYPTCPPTLG